MTLFSAISTAQLALFAGFIFTCFFFVLVIQPLFSEQEKFLNAQSWVGLKQQWFSKFRASFAVIRSTKDLVKEGYDKYSKHNMPFILPQFSSEPLVVLSASQMKELLAMPDNKIDALIPNAETIATRYTTGYDISLGPHIDVVRHQLTRRLPLLTSDVYEELNLAMKSQWNASADEWRTVKAYPSCMKIVSRAANRVFAGKELCREMAFIDHSREYTIAVFSCGALMKLIPKWLQPVAAPFLTRGVKHHLAECAKVALPIIRKRLADIQNPPADFKPPVDALQWMLEDCNELARNDPTELNELKLVRRLLLLNMVAIHTTSMVTTNTILDVYSSPHKEEYVAGLREEIERVLRENGGEFTKQAINSMFRVDSAIRDSMRFSSLTDIGIRRMVTAESGVDLSGGVHIPKGSQIVAATHGIHMDSVFYGDSADSYDAFRFSRPRETYLTRVQKTGSDSDHLKSLLEQKNQNLTATSEDFLAFGHGRHACPGRFFASQEMKLMIAHIVMNYDIQISGGRPKNIAINGSNIPRDECEMQVKLRA